MSAAALDFAVDTRDATIAEHEDRIRVLLERIGMVTGVELSTAPTPAAVAEGLRVLDSLTSPTTEKPGNYWGDPIGDGPDGLTGPFFSGFAAEADAREHSDELPHGFVLITVRDGRMLAPMYVPPAGKGAN